MGSRPVSRPKRQDQDEEKQCGTTLSGDRGLETTSLPVISHVVSDVKFHEIFWREIFHEIIREIFLKH